MEKDNFKPEQEFKSNLASYQADFAEAIVDIEAGLNKLSLVLEEIRSTNERSEGESYLMIAAWDAIKGIHNCIHQSINTAGENALEACKAEADKRKYDRLFTAIRDSVDAIQKRQKKYSVYRSHESICKSLESVVKGAEIFHPYNYEFQRSIKWAEFIDGEMAKELAKLEGTL